MRLRFAGGGPSLSERALEESMPSGQGVPLSDDSWEAGGEGYDLVNRNSGGGDGDDAGELKGELMSLSMSSVSQSIAKERKRGVR